MPGYQPDPQTLQNLGSIVDQLAQAKVINQNFVHPPRILARLPAGALYFDSNLELDTDGWVPGGDQGDQDWQSGTSLYYNPSPSGHGLVYLNANQVPYFVLPLPKTWPTQYGISLGDYAAVLYKNHLAYAVFGDFGPPNKLGEGSIELLRLLGQDRIKGNNQVIDSGMGPGVITIVFPGSGSSADRTDQATLIAAINRKGPLLLAALQNPADAKVS
jgi:Fungal chitosanase of glycosyl hydrolase group 75